MSSAIKLTLVGLLVLLVGGYLVFSGDENDAVIDNLKPRDVSPAGVKIIAFGDSLTAGYGLPASDSYPAQLEAVLRARKVAVTVINVGVSGETSEENLARAMSIREQEPDIVLLGIGGNDALRRLPIAETKDNIDATITKLLSGENPPVVVLLRMQAPLTSGLSYKQSFDDLYDELAGKHNILLVPFLSTEVFLNNANKLSDGIHLNQEGYRQVVESYLAPVLEEVIGKLVAN